MNKPASLITPAVFEGKQIRRIWDDAKEKWYFSVVDVIEALIYSPNSRSYWKVLKNRLKKEGSEVVTKCNQLKMQAADGKYYLTDAADTETMFRIIQSIPSPNAEPFKFIQKCIIEIELMIITLSLGFVGRIKMSSRRDEFEQIL